MKRNKYLSNTPDEAFKILAKNFSKWERINTNHIQVLTPGYCNSECMKMENELKSVGMYATRRTYDKRSGKTITLYKMVG